MLNNKFTQINPGKWFRLSILALLVSSQSLLFANTPLPPLCLPDAVSPSAAHLLIDAAVEEANHFHLFSHGRLGELLLDGKWLNAPQIAQWLNNNITVKRIKDNKDLPTGHNQKILNQEEIEDVQLTFGQTLDLKPIPKEVTWVIKGDNSLFTGSGNELNKHIFSIPGNYIITIRENHSNVEGECYHTNLPNVIKLNVSPVKMLFHKDELALSKTIKKGTSTEGITLSIPVTVTTFRNQEVINYYDYTSVKTSGVGTQISATLSSSTKLKQGKQLLHYNLSGVAQEEAYIMFDFTDINGQVQTIALKDLIK